MAGEQGCAKAAVSRQGHRLRPTGQRRQETRAIVLRVAKFRLTRRTGLILAHDLVVTAAAMLASFYIRFEARGLAERKDLLLAVLPSFVIYAGLVYAGFKLYKTKWRFASLPDLYNIFRASTVLALSLLVLDYILVAPNLYATFFFGKITIALYWFVAL